MFFRVKKIHLVISSFLLVFTLLLLGSIGTVEAAALIDAPSANPPTLTPVQHYPYHYPPGYNPPNPGHLPGHQRGERFRLGVYRSRSSGSGRVYRRT